VLLAPRQQVTFNSAVAEVVKDLVCCAAIATGSFPETPVMPGVLVIEGIAQTACVLALRLMPPTERRRSMFFMTIDKAKFRKPVRPGDTLEYHVDKVAKRRNMWWYRGEAKVGSVLVAEAELGACLAEN
jgi:3-hydroxyacyl-[acyl-carrier-protein] dehydratase